MVAGASRLAPARSGIGERRCDRTQLWIADDGRLERYQQIQKRPVFLGARLLASFVATPFNETLFVGLYEIQGLSTAATGLVDPDYEPRCWRPQLL